MGVYKRDNYYWIDYMAGETRIRESTGTASKKRAQQLLAKRRVEVFEGRFNVQSTKPSPKLSEYVGTPEDPGEYLKYSKANKRPNSHRRDTTSAKNILAFFGERRLNSITPMLIEHYKRKRTREDGRAVGTVNRELAFLKHVYTLAIRDRLTLSNPVKEVEMFNERQRTTVFSREQEAGLLSGLKPENQRVIICAVETGTRKGEVKALDWKHVDLVRGLIWVEAAKTDKGREIPISPRLKAVLLETPKLARIGLVFKRPNGAPIKSLRTDFVKAREAAGLGPEYNFHALRHTFGTRQDEMGTGSSTLAALMGHSTIVTTQRYTHPDREAKRQAIKRQAEAYRDSQGDLKPGSADGTNLAQFPRRRSS